MRSYGYCCVAYVFGSFFGNNFAFENLQPLANPKSGWFTSIIMIVAVAPWAYVGFDDIPQTAEEFNFSPNKTFKLIVYSLLAASLTYVVMILYTGWLSTNNASLNGNLGNRSLKHSRIWLYWFRCISHSNYYGDIYRFKWILMSASRLLFSMGRSGIMPTAFSKLHSKYKTPYVAIIFLVVLH